MIIAKTKHHRPISQLCLGAAQIGMEYGIANRSGLLDADAANAMLIAASAAGVTLVDTARVYGSSEQRIGAARQAYNLSAMTIMTKLAPLDAEVKDGNISVLQEAVTQSVQKSLNHLGLSCLPYLQLHRVAHLHACDGAIWNQLLRLKQEGKIERLGVSVATPEEAIEALNIPDVESLQLPYNILDVRWERAGISELLSKRSDVFVATRSSLLQGLLTQEASAWPVIEHKQAERITQLLDEWVIRYSRKNRVDLCLAFVRAQRWIDSVVVGMETMEQLQENVAMFERPPLTQEACAEIRGVLPAFNEALLNPALWNQAKVASEKPS